MFLNGTSYAGVDIKVLIQLYNNNETAAAAKLKTLSKTAKAAADQTADLLSQISKVDAAFMGTKTGTVERTRLSNKRVRLHTQLEASYKTSKDTATQQSKLSGTSKKSPTKVLAECQTLSVSTHRAKTAVRACGHSYPKGFTRGERQIAGSMIFTVFNEHVLYDFLDAHASDFDSVGFTSAILDQIPPVDILISFANEYGSISRMTIYGVEFVDEGQVMSIEDMLTENVTQFVARDYDPMRSVQTPGLTTFDHATGHFAPMQGQRASNLLLESDHRDVAAMVDPFDRFNRRRNPFL